MDEQISDLLKELKMNLKVLSVCAVVLALISIANFTISISLLKPYRASLNSSIIPSKINNNSTRAQQFLSLANEQFTKGDLDNASLSVEKAFELDPDNSIIKNSLVLIVGEKIQKDYKEGRFETALKKIEYLQKIIPDDLDVIKMRDQILKSKK